MNVLEANIAVGLGDILYMKGCLDHVKDQFSQIKLTFDPGIIRVWRYNDPWYSIFLKELGQLFFSEPPYLLNAGQFPYKTLDQLATEHNFSLMKPDLTSFLCKGEPLNLDKDYIVITTKLRLFPKPQWQQMSPRFWIAMKELSRRYKIVVMGEKIVEMSREYKHHGADKIYSIYDEIIANLPKDRVVDLTIPALGITPPKLAQIQQDALIMNQAKFVVMLSNGGAFCMATSVAEMTIGFRNDNDIGGNLIFNKPYTDAFITKSWPKFLKKLHSYV